MANISLFKGHRRATEHGRYWCRVTDRARSAPGAREKQRELYTTPDYDRFEDAVADARRWCSGGGHDFNADDPF